MLTHASSGTPIRAEATRSGPELLFDNNPTTEYPSTPTYTVGQGETFLTADRILVGKRLKNKGSLSITSYTLEGEIQDR